MLTALKCSGTSVTVGSLAAATTLRVIAGAAGVVCAAPEAGSAIAPSNNSPVVLNCMIASQVQRIPEHHTLSWRLLKGWRRRDRNFGDVDFGCWQLAAFQRANEFCLQRPRRHSRRNPRAASPSVIATTRRTSASARPPPAYCLAITESHQGQTPFRRS